METAGRHLGNLVAASLAPGTWASYDSDWKIWKDWCAIIGAGEDNEPVAAIAMRRVGRLPEFPGPLQDWLSVFV